MEKHEQLHYEIKCKFTHIMQKFGHEELQDLSASNEDYTAGSAETRRWIRDSLIGYDSALLHAFIACSYSDRDDMTEYILQEFTDYAKGIG